LLSSCRKTSGWQLGCYTRPWSKHDYRVAFDGMAEAGYKYAGLMTSSTGLLVTAETTPEQAQTIGEEAKSRGLTIVSAWGNIDVRKSVDDGIAGLRKVIDNFSISSNGGSTLLLGGTSNPDLVENYFKVIAECCDYAAEKGVGLSLKPHGGPNTTGPECRALIQKVGHKNFNLWYDPGNIYYYTDAKLNPVDDSREVDGLVVGMSVKDYIHPKEVNVTPGDGMVNFQSVMANLRQGGFTRGPLIVETLSQGDLAHINAEAAKTRRFLEELVG
jgi:sugar phosphate isomerase/epimerase